jgi:hypothetical protein
MDAFEANGFDAAPAQSFNAAINARYEGIRDYIVCHYRVNQRSDTDYWRANATNQALSESLKGVMTAWFTGRDLTAEIMDQGIAKYYAPQSWHCLLGGHGTYPDDASLKPPEADLPKVDMAAIDRFIAGCALNFGSHDAALQPSPKPAA